MEVGRAGSAPHFIYMHHTSLTAPAHLLFLFAFLSVVFSAHNDLACLRCLSLLALVRMCSSQWLQCGSLDLSFAPGLDVFHLERERFNARARKRSGSRQSVWQYVNPVNVVWVGPSCDNFWCSWRPLAQTSRASSSRWAKNVT